jgi:hypothetical protein
MPLSVLDLEDAIDHLAGPEHWSTRQKVPPEVDNCGLSEVPAQNVSLPDTIPAAGVKKP